MKIIDERSVVGVLAKVCAVKWTVICRCMQNVSVFASHPRPLSIRWPGCLPQLPAVWVQWWEHWVLGVLRGLQEDQESREDGHQSQENLRGLHPIGGTQRGQGLHGVKLTLTWKQSEMSRSYVMVTCTHCIMSTTGGHRYMRVSSEEVSEKGLENKHTVPSYVISIIYYDYLKSTSCSLGSMKLWHLLHLAQTVWVNSNDSDRCGRSAVNTGQHWSLHQRRHPEEPGGSFPFDLWPGPKADLRPDGERLLRSFPPIWAVPGAAG